jgi:hypothetical protein
MGKAPAAAHIVRKPLCVLARKLEPVAVVKEDHSLTSRCIDQREVRADALASDSPSCRVIPVWL